MRPCCLVGVGLLLFSVRFSLVMRLLAFLLCVLDMALIPALIVPRRLRLLPVSMPRSSRWSLVSLAAKLLADTLPSLADGTAVWTEQDEALVTHAAKISKLEMRLDPQMAALDCVRHVLASSDTAPARCVIAGKTVRVLDAAPADVSLGEGAVDVKNKRVYLGLSDGSVELLEVKPMVSVLWPLLLGCWPAGRRSYLGCFVMSKLSPARKLALDVLMEPIAAVCMRATCCPLAHLPRLLTSAIPLLPLVWHWALRLPRVFWTSCSISFLISLKRLRRVFAWRFVSRPSRCSIYIRLAASP